MSMDASRKSVGGLDLPNPFSDEAEVDLQTDNSDINPRSRKSAID